MYFEIKSTKDRTLRVATASMDGRDPVCWEVAESNATSLSLLMRTGQCGYAATMRRSSYRGGQLRLQHGQRPVHRTPTYECTSAMQVRKPCSKAVPSTVYGCREISNSPHSIESDIHRQKISRPFSNFGTCCRAMNFLLMVATRDVQVFVLLTPRHTVLRLD